jgi:hypothetical protein
VTGDERAAVRRRWIGLVAVAGGLMAFGAGFLPWLTTETEDGGTTSITGWGGITGSSGIAGTNLNDVLGGAGTYRPALIGLVFGVIAGICGFVLLAHASDGRRPHRVTAAVLTLCGIACLGFGLWRGIDPGDASVFEAGETSAAFGPWLTAIAGLTLLAAAAAIFGGAIDPASRPARRGIQPR